jgi:hypothetical protein
MLAGTLLPANWRVKGDLGVLRQKNAARERPVPRSRRYELERFFPGLDEGRTYRIRLCALGLPVRVRTQTGDLCGEKSGLGSTKFQPSGSDHLHGFSEVY